MRGCEGREVGWGMGMIVEGQWRLTVDQLLGSRPYQFNGPSRPVYPYLLTATVLPVTWRGIRGVACRHDADAVVKSVLATLRRAGVEGECIVSTGRFGGFPGRGSVLGVMLAKLGRWGLRWFVEGGCDGKNQTLYR